MQEPNQNDGRMRDLNDRVRDLRNRLAVIRHRMPARFAGRGRLAAIAVAVLAAVGLAALGVVSANFGGNTPTTATADHSVADRLGDARADRGTRPSGTPGSDEPDPGASGRASKAPVTDTPRSKASGTPKASPSPKKTKPPAWVPPMPNAPVTSCFGMRWGVLHAGIDYALPPGTPVHSIGAGTVTAAGWNYSGYGISVVVDHGNGYLSHYAHLSGTAVGAGQRVSPGTVIGYEGTTGDSTGPHLHFEIHNGMWNQVEPAAWLRAHGVNPGGC